MMESIFRVYARPNARETRLLGWDEEKKAYRMDVKARPEDGKANLEIIKYLTKHLKKKVAIKSGHTSRIKTIIAS
jgi:uncharacterized protein (TIGR00251 family)